MNNLKEKTELFELCKEVSQRTGWDAEDLHDYLRLHKPNGHIEVVNKYSWLADKERYSNSPQTPRFNAENEVVILYTSDYILEKLPPKYRGAWLSVYPMDKQGTWGAGYETEEEGLIADWSDTPLKALLKLVIALDDAGELSHE